METTQLPPQTPIEQPIQNQAPEHKSFRYKKFAIIAAILLVLLFVGNVGAYYFATKIKEENKNHVVPQTIVPTKPAPIPTTALVATLITDPTTIDWKTYTGNGFSFKYPTSWTIVESNTSNTFSVQIANPVTVTPWPTINTKNPSAGGSGCDIYNYGESIIISAPDGYTNAKKLVENQRQFAEKNPDPSTVAKFKATEANINGLPSEAYYGNVGMCTGTWFVDFSNDKKVIEFQTPLTSPTDDVFSGSIYTKILSTFKFTDQHQTADTSNWKTYTNSQYKYSVQYPTSKLVRLQCPDEELDLIPLDDTNGGLEGKPLPTCGRDGRYTIEMKTHPLNYTPIDLGDHYQVTTEKITVNSIPATRYTYVQVKQYEGQSPPLWFQEVLIPGRNIYEFHLDKKEYQELFNSVINTFKETN